MDENFLRHLGAYWYSHSIFFSARQGSAGKSGSIIWQLKIGSETSSEGRGVIEVIPPIIPDTPPCKKFRLMIPSHTASSHPGINAMDSFWKSLAARPLVWGDYFAPELPGYDYIVRVCGPCWTLIPAMKKPLEALKRELPRNITDRGTPSHGFSTWSKVDDQTGNVEKFLRTGVRELLKLNPDIHDVVWDFEPHPYGYDQGGRARFARLKKLPEVPSIAEINTDHKHQYFQYMVDLHAQYINKVIRIFREEAPHVRFWLCSDNLSSGPNPVSAWCGVDIRLSDHAVHGHMPMPYYAGKRFFDDVQFNIASLKKPVFPLINSAEGMLSYYLQYTPRKVHQNIIAVAALGGAGIGFWQGDSFSGDYHREIAKAYAAVSRYEDFYTAGERADKTFAFTPVNVVRKKVKNQQGKAITLCFPDFPRDLRKTVHKLNNDYLFTLFNYHESLPMLWEIKGPGKVFYASVPPNGVTIFKLSELKNQDALRKAAKKFAEKTISGNLEELHRDGASLEWSAGIHGEPLFKMTNGTLTALIDVVGDGRIAGLHDTAGSTCMGRGFLGKLVFYDPLQQPIEYKINRVSIEKSIPELVIRGRVPAYGGANPTINPLLGLEISIRYALTHKTLDAQLSFHNSTPRSMKFGFRINHYPELGRRFNAREVRAILRDNGKDVPISLSHCRFARKGFESIFHAGRRTEPWSGGAITMEAKNGTLRDRIVITPDRAFTGIYSWIGNPDLTVELLSPHVTLPPGGTVQFEYSISSENQ